MKFFKSTITRRRVLKLAGAVAGSRLIPAFANAHVGGSLDNPLRHAKVVWHMASLHAEGSEALTLKENGNAKVISLGTKLEQTPYAESLKRGGDGLAATFDNSSPDTLLWNLISDDTQGWLSLDAEQVKKLGFKGSSISLYVRTLLKQPDGWGTLFFSRCVGLAVHRSGLAIAFIRQRTSAGFVFRELPLGVVDRGIWLDLIIRINDRRLDFFCNGALRNSIWLDTPMDAALQSEVSIGAYAGMPTPERETNRSLCLSHASVDTVAVWNGFLTDAQAAFLCGSSALQPQRVQSPVDQAIAAYNQFYDASQNKDLERCRRLENSMRGVMRKDPLRPVFHLTAPIGWIFDPSGAFQFQGKYHVFSYHNIFALLRFNGHDHYVSDDLVHWRMWPTAPMADHEKDDHGIWLTNHILDGEGLPNVIYGGFDSEGEQGIRAVSRDGMISYTDKKVVLPDYHDGHVWKEGDTWYAITMRRVAKKTPKDPEIVIFSSTDLDRWQERGVLFRPSDHLAGKKIPDMEFPYLFVLGGKHVLMAGSSSGVVYWLGRFDTHAFKFIPDGNEALRVDYANPFHCFNPSTVDAQGPGGASRRIIMAMYAFVKGGVDGLPWSGVHAMPRVLSLDGNRLRQDPLPQFESLRGQHHSIEGIAVKANGSGYVSPRGDALEIKAEFNNHDASVFGVKVRLSEDGKTFARIFYDARTNEYGVDGNIAEPMKEFFKERTTKGPTYIPAGQPVLMHIFLDKALIETFVNGQTCTTSLADADPAHVGLDLFCQGGSVTCKRLDIWQMRSSF